MNARQRKFAHEYVKNGFVGVQAVLAAGYGMGYNAACVHANYLLRNPKVQKAVEDHLNKAKMDADEVLEKLTTIARKEADFKGSDVVKAAELLGKGHKLFTDKVEVEQVSDEIDLGADMIQIAQSLRDNPDFAAKVKERLALRAKSE